MKKDTYDYTPEFHNAFDVQLLNVRLNAKTKLHPFFLAVAIANSKKETEYIYDGVFTGADHIKLKDDRFKRFLLATQEGSNFVPREDLPDGDTRLVTDSSDDDLSVFDGTSWYEQVDVKVINEIDKFCREHNIPYVSCFCVKNDADGTVYRESTFYPDEAGVSLTNNFFDKYRLIMEKDAVFVLPGTIENFDDDAMDYIRTEFEPAEESETD